MLLLDEPLSALDAKVRLQLREEIRRVQLDLGITTLFVTHDQEEALSMADRVAAMRAGRMEQCAAPSELYDRLATAFVAEFVGTMNHLAGTMIDTDLVEVAGQRLPVDGERPTPGTKVKGLLRPEAISLKTIPASTDSPSTAHITDIPSTYSTSGTGTPLGTVRIATFLRAITRITVLLDDGTEVKADVPSHRASTFPAAARVRLIPAARPALVIEP